MRLLVRADDAGLCDAVNDAIVQTVERGVVRNVSVMVPTPSFERAAELLRGLPGIAVGLHVTLSSEWVAPRWGPVLPVGRVRSLADRSDNFFSSPADLHATGRLDLGEAVAEVEAQLGRARQAGLAVRYLDEHMGVGRLPGLRAELRDLARREGLVTESGVDRLPAGDPDAGIADRIRAADDGTYALITHPGVDTAELRAIRGVGFEAPGSVARSRDADRHALVGADVRRACAERNVELVRYPDLAAG